MGGTERGMEGKGREGNGREGRGEDGKAMEGRGGKREIDEERKGRETYEKKTNMPKRENHK